MQAQRRRFRLIFSFVPAVAIALFLGLSGVAAEQTANVGVQMGDNFFNPASTTVNVGDTVTWTNVGNRPHDVTSTDGGPLNSPRTNARSTQGWTARSSSRPPARVAPVVRPEQIRPV